ncbi:hypothetical protein MXB_5687, partial [Myxobolus squamalis]
YIFESRAKIEITNSFRQILVLPNENILPLTEDEKTAINRFYLAFLKHENISQDTIDNHSFSEKWMEDLRSLLQLLKQEQVQKFIKYPESQNSSSTSIETYNITTINDTNITDPVSINNVTNQKKSEILKEMNDDMIDQKTLDSIIDELTDSNEDENPKNIYKRKEINEASDYFFKNKDHMSRDDLFPRETEDGSNDSVTLGDSKNMNEEMFNRLAKEGWKHYQEISKHEEDAKGLSQAETLVDHHDQKMNYLHWNFETYEGRKIMGTPGNPMMANGNLLFNKGSVTFLEDSGGYLNGGEYKDFCISGKIIIFIIKKDPSKCVDGFSLQFTLKISSLPSKAKDNQLFIMDTGASSPDSRGFSIFLIQNDTIGVHVADGEHNWCAAKNFSKQLLNKWISLIIIFNQSEGISMISNCKDILWEIPFGRCTPCIDCHQTDLKTSLTIGRPNNIYQDYITLPMIISDLEIFFYPLNHTKIFEKCGILDSYSRTIKKDNILNLYSGSTGNSYFNNPYISSPELQSFYPRINPCDIIFIFILRSFSRDS